MNTRKAETGRDSIESITGPERINNKLVDINKVLALQRPNHTRDNHKNSKEFIVDTSAQ